MAEEAYQCFKDVLDNVPGWITDLEAILSDTTARQNELVAASRTSQPSGFLAKLRAASRSSFTLGSRRSKDARRTREPQITKPDAAHVPPRRRSPGSALSASESGLTPTRNRSSVPVVYDGEVQKKFENLVRAVGGSRNTLRKGKMGAKLDSITRSGSSSSASSNVSSDDTAELTFNPKNFKPKRAPFASFHKPDNAESFDQVDSILDKMQGFCEKAAFHVLRDGDCRSEIHSATKQLVLIRQVLESELPMWQKKADKAAARRQRSQERLRQEEADLAAREEKLSLATTLTFPSDSGLASDLEADDTEEGEEPEISLASLRLPPKRQPYRPAHHVLASAY